MPAPYCWNNQSGVYQECSDWADAIEIWTCTSADLVECNALGPPATYEIQAVSAVYGGGGSTSGFPELTVEGGASIAAAVLALWACAWAFRVIARQLWES